MSGLEPRSTSYRTMAALAYVLPVALWLLVAEDYREATFVRDHARRSVAMHAVAATAVVLLGGASSLLGALPGVGFAFLLASGLFLAAVPVLLVVAAGLSAMQAYQGRRARLPWDPASRPAAAGEVTRTVPAAPEAAGPRRPSPEVAAGGRPVPDAPVAGRSRPFDRVTLRPPEREGLGGLLARLLAQLPGRKRRRRRRRRPGDAPGGRPGPGAGGMGYDRGRRNPRP